jgi:hypothetical protein
MESLAVIISHRRKFIFLHCPKTAGSAISVYLSRVHGPNDLQIGIWADCMAAGVIPNRRLFLDVLRPSTIAGIVRRTALQRLPLREAANRAHKNLFRAKLGRKPEHAPAALVREAYPMEWNSYFKFCFVRNPYERLVSDYLWLKPNWKRPRTFRDFLENAIVAESTFLIEGAIALDFVGRYERLAQDFSIVCSRLGIEFNSDEFPIVKRGTDYDYRTFYGPEELKIVEQRCKNELALYEYTF